MTQLNKYYNSAAPFDYEGNNLSIACISNSFAANIAHPAAFDVTNNDLPGGATNPRNTTPVFVLLDDLSSATSGDQSRIHENSDNSAGSAATTIACYRDISPIRRDRPRIEKCSDVFASCRISASPSDSNAGSCSSRDLTERISALSIGS